VTHDDLKQNAGDNSLVVAAGRDINLTGVSPKDVLEILRRRDSNLQSVLTLVQKLLERMDVSGSQIPLKTRVQVNQYASLEDNQYLRDRWAFLLANSALDNAQVLPSYPEILRQLSVTEAMFLEAIYKYVCRKRDLQVPKPPDDPDVMSWIDIGAWQELLGLFVQAGLTTHAHEILVDQSKRFEPSVSADHTRFNVARDNLIRSQLLQRNSKDVSDGQPKFHQNDHFSMTSLGFQFVTACQPPRATRL
jgi:hypothetical protein